MTEIASKIKEFIQSNRVLTNEPMSKHTTFRIGGNADIFVSVKNEAEIEHIINVCNEYNENYFIMGNGSNLLVKDSGFRGVIVQIYKDFADISVNNNVIEAQAGALMSTIGSVALKNSLTGFEFASGIPGTLGGGVCMNAGAYGGELKDIVTKVKVIHNGEIKVLDNGQCGFGYRTSNIQKEGMIVLSAEIVLEKGVYELIKERMQELKEKRCDKQPLEYPSAGSTFKRPEGYFAAKLIDDAGLRGFTVGGAMVSDKHCGFVINKGNAKADDVLKLMSQVKERVKECFGVELEPEVRIIGE